jgi:hypothetical protein
MTAQARKVSGTTAKSTPEPVQYPSVVGNMDRSDVKKNSVVYRDAEGFRFMGSVYIPNDLLAQIGNPAGVEITIRPLP